MKYISLFICTFSILINYKLYLGNKSKKLYIFDIDNTLCDTWKTISNNRKRNFKYILEERKRIKKIKLFEKMNKYIKDKKDNKNIVIFLSARKLFLFDVTIKFLKKNKLIENFFSALLVNDVYDKIIILEIILKITNKKIYFYDDLSYNHENKDVLFYNNVILQVENMDLTYINYAEIKKLQ